MSDRQILKCQNSRGTFFAVIAATAFLCSISGPASAIPDYVNAACKKDYKRFCPSYELETSELRQCMRSVEKQLSSRCIDALEKSGEKRRK